MLVKAGKPRAVSQHLTPPISLPGLDRLPCAYARTALDFLVTCNVPL